MKTLADLKRTIQVGTQIEKTKHINIDNGVEVSCPPHPSGVRTIVKVQTKSWALQSPEDGTVSWLDIPKAKELSFNGNEFTITTWEGRLKMTYRIVE